MAMGGKTATFSVSGMDTAMHLRYQLKSCASCRYYREHATGGVVSECLLLGRTLGITSRNTSHELRGWARQRLCDGWKRRPKTWEVYSDGVDSNPHWVDPYLPRTTLERLRLSLAKRLKLHIHRSPIISSQGNSTLASERRNSVG